MRTRDVLAARLATASAAATREATAAVLCGAVLLGGLSTAIMAFLDLPASFLAGSWAVYLPGCGLLLATVGDAHPFARFGWPNLVTHLRLTLTSLLGGLAGVVHAGPLPGQTAWIFLAVAGTAIVLDGVDGWLARRLDMRSPFGARFDMEVDALLILLLSLLAWLQARAGLWVMAIGLARYGFVAAGWLWPALARPLPPSWRRKGVCVVQGLVLGILLTPVVAPPASTGLAGLALALLAYSFTVDIVWLLRRDE